MNQDTIPSQLAPITIPSTLGAMDTSSRKGEAPSNFGPALKWFLGALAAAVLLYLAK